MVDERADESGQMVETREVRAWPYQRVGLALLVLVVALVGGGLVLDHRFRPVVGIEALTVTPAAQTTTDTYANQAGAIASPEVGGSNANLLKQEIIAAYLHYWDIRSQAYLTLNTSEFPMVMAENELARERRQVEDLAARGRAGKLDVDHHIALIDFSEDQATVYDEYLNRSVILDASTMQEIPAKDPPETEKISYDMRKVDGQWKVIDGQQYH